MIKTFVGALALAAAAAPLAVVSHAHAADLKVLSEKTVTGFGHVESVAYDPKAHVFYTSDFGPAPTLKPADKDGQGKITKVSLDGKIIEDGFIKPPGNVMNKPKGIWVRGNRLWVTDIDSVWVFDLKTKEGKKLPLPGVVFANDPTVMGKALYVSDNRSDQLVKVEPADFLHVKSPKITVVYHGGGVHPNGLYPAPHGVLLMVGFADPKDPHAIYEMKPGKQPVAISDKIGLLDGLYRMKDGSLLATDWVSGSLFHWSKKGGVQKLATGFKGPADICVVPNKQGYLVAVPDLVKGEIRLVQLSR